LLSLILPNPRSEQYRLRTLQYISRIITEAAPQVVVVPYGSFVSKTYLPDSDLDLCCYSAYCSHLETLNLVKGALERKSQEYREYQAYRERFRQGESGATVPGASVPASIDPSPHSANPPLFPIEDLSVVVAEVSIIKFICGGIGFDISFSQPGGLVTALFIECLDRAVGRGHLLKKSLILTQAWCLYEARILGSHNMMLNSYSMRTMVIHIVLSCPQICSPLQALLTFLGYYSCFQWDISILSLAGPIPFEALAGLDSMPFSSELRPVAQGGASLGEPGAPRSTQFSQRAQQSQPQQQDPGTAETIGAVSPAGDALGAKREPLESGPFGSGARPARPPSPYPRAGLDLCGPLFWYISKPFYIKLTLMRLLNDTGFSQPKGIEKLFGRVGPEYWALQDPSQADLSSEGPPAGIPRPIASLHLSAECVSIVSSVRKNALEIIGRLERLRSSSSPLGESSDQYNPPTGADWPRPSGRKRRGTTGGFVVASESEQSGGSEDDDVKATRVPRARLNQLNDPDDPDDPDDLGNPDDRDDRDDLDDLDDPSGPRGPKGAKGANKANETNEFSPPGISPGPAGSMIPSTVSAESQYRRLGRPGPEALAVCVGASMDDILLAAVLQLIRSPDFIFLNSERVSFSYKENKLNIMDPLQLSNNIGRSVSSYSARRIRRSFQVGFNQLSMLVSGLVSGDTTVAMALADLDAFFSTTLSMYEPGHDRCDHALGRVVSDFLPDCLVPVPERRSRSHLLPTVVHEAASGPLMSSDAGFYAYPPARSSSGPAQAGRQNAVPPDAPMLVPSPLLALQSQNDPLSPSEQFFDLDDDALAGNLEELYSGCELVCAAVLGCRKVQGALLDVAANFR